MTFGLTSTGFQKKTLEDILADITADLITNVSAGLDCSSSSPMGQIIAPFAQEAADLWDALQADYTAQNPDLNGGDAQDSVASITGSTRAPATKSQVRIQLIVNGTGVTIPVGSIVSDGTLVRRFKFVGQEAVIGTVVPGDFVSPFPGTFYGRFEAENVGVLAANAGTLTTIVTPVTNWAGAYNALDATPGTNVETDAVFRVRREAELAGAGSSPVDALEADLIALKPLGVQQASVTENVLDTTDANGVPPHSIEALIYDGPSPLVSNNVIAQQIWDSKGGGIRTYGNTSGTATDRKGVSRTVAFSRPTSKNVYFTITIKVDPALFPSGGDTLVKAAVVAYGTPLAPGATVFLSSFYPAIFAACSGVVSITDFRAGFSVSPSGPVDLPIGVREKAAFDTSRVVIVHA
jgi:uncharacterized phage protein gp47/JayE